NQSSQPPQTLKDDCAPTCAHCQSRQPCAKGQWICRVPHILVVLLKRFAYDGTKIHFRVNIEERLELCKQHFVLTSVVLHQGSEIIGHYYTLYRERNNQWVQLDDQLISDESSLE